MADVTISQLTQGTPGNAALLPYAQGGNTLCVAASALLQNTGNIGIGTANPTKRLHVVGPAANGAGNEAILIDANSVQLAVRRDPAGGGTIEIGSPNSHNLGIFTNGTLAAFFGVGAAFTPGIVGIGTTTPQATLDVNGVIRADGFTTANAMTPYYNEGADCRTFLTNWNKTANYNMTILGEFGNCWVHGWDGVAGNYTLTLNNIPAHAQVKYECNIHHVDSWDGEAVEIYTTNSSNAEVLRTSWNKIMWGLPHNVYNLPGTASTFTGPQRYSYTPWADANIGPWYKTMPGVTKFTSGWYDHASTQFVARHYTGCDTVQSDEAFYISHVRLFIR